MCLKSELHKKVHLEILLPIALLSPLLYLPPTGNPFHWYPVYFCVSFYKDKCMHVCFYILCMCVCITSAPGFFHLTVHPKKSPQQMI